MVADLNERVAILRFDGGAKPGRATAGAVLTTEDGRTISHLGQFLGNETNNVAEHTALAIGLELARDCGVARLRAFGDSELVLGQAFRGWGAQGKLAELAERSRSIARTFARTFAHFSFRHAARELNAPPDALCHAVEEGWWLAPGASRDDGMADLGFVSALELPISEVQDLRRRGAIKGTLRSVVEGAAPLAIERAITRTTADPFINEATGLAILTFCVRVRVGAVTARSADRRAELEERLRSSIAVAAAARGTTRTRLARISG